MKRLDRIFLMLLWMGLLLFPFSTSPGTFIVIHFGHPFLLLAGGLGFAMRIWRAQRLDTLECLGFLWVAGMFLTAFWARAPFPSLARVGTHLCGLGVFLGARGAVAGSGKDSFLESLRGALVGSGLVLAAYYLLNLVFNIQSQGLAAVLLQRYVGGAASLPWGATNTVGACLLIPLLAVFALEGKPMRFRGMMAVLIVVAILSTFSRTLLALVLLLLLGILVLERSTTMLKVLAGLGLLLVPISRVLMGQDAEAVSRIMADRTDTEGLSTLNDRTVIWQTMFSRFASNPLGGVGYYGALDAYGFSGHNILLTTLAEGGLLGLASTVAFLAMLFLVVFRRGGRSVKRIPFVEVSRGGWCLGLVLLNMMAEDAYFTYIYIVYFWVFAAVLTARRSRWEGVNEFSA